MRDMLTDRGGAEQRVPVSESTHNDAQEGETMNRSTYLLCILVTTAVFFGLTTPILAGPTPTPIPETDCQMDHPVSTAFTDAKGQGNQQSGFGRPVNTFISHAITGHIVKVKGTADTAQQFEVCVGTLVTAVIDDRLGIPVQTATGDLECAPAGPVPNTCSGVINVKSKYSSVSTASTDKDTITLIPCDGNAPICN